MKLKQILAIVLSLALVACISVAATVAYLSDTDMVTNTFSVGEVDIKLDEAKVGPDGKVDPSASPERVQENKYHVYPGMEYDKDPTIWVQNGSENCYLIAEVTVANADLDDLIGYTETADGKSYIGFGEIVSGGVMGEGYTYKNEENKAGWGWYKDGVALTQAKDGDKYKLMIYFENEFDADSNNKAVLFEKLSIPGEWTNDQLAKIQNMEIDVKAYAVQTAGFADVYTAFKTNEGKWTENN